MQVAGHGDPTIVFEAGGGDDSSVWAQLEPQVRAGFGVRTVVYDRAGFGKSAPSDRTYRIDEEAIALAGALDRFGVTGPIVIVAHSYGGFIATILAARDKRVAGLVLVDANLAESFDHDEVDHVLSRYLPQLDQLTRTDPARARVMGPILRAYPDTVAAVRAAPPPAAMPIFDIVAEKSWGDSDAENAVLRKGHDEFVAASPARMQVVAAGSGHYVMRDQPQLVIDAIARMIRLVHR
jgi:pimeloyl-ACP methyl ester carboxylesterase